LTSFICFKEAKREKTYICGNEHIDVKGGKVSRNDDSKKG
jgi:hypothetical protein